MTIHTLSALFCDNGGLVVLPESARFQGSFDALTGLFLPSGPPDQRGKYGEHVLLAMSHPPRMFK